MAVFLVSPVLLSAGGTNNGRVYISFLWLILQADILDVNQIFRDLGMMVHEQGEVVGNSSVVHSCNF